MTRQHLFFILGLAACVVLAAVFVPPPPVANPQPFEWTLTDVRSLDPADAPQPTHDLLAVYLHPAPGELYLRVDLLDHARLPDYDLYLALDTSPAGVRSLPIDASCDFAWDVLLAVPAFGELGVLDSALQPLPGASLAVFRDPTLDTLTLRLAGEVVPAERAQVQVFITPAGSPQVADLTQPSSATAVTLQPARVLLAFTDSFPAYTPATALRRWNGAHTGPLGSGHGLALLLRTARKYRVPLALIDLRLPASLAALEPVGGLPLVQEMAAEGLLMLPEPLLDLPAESEIVARWQAETRRVSDGFGLPPQALAAVPNTQLGDFTTALVVFVGRPAAILHTLGWQAPELAPTRLKRQGSRKLVRLSIPVDAEQAALDGPSIEVKRGLAAAAASSNQTGGAGSFLLLGGSLPDSSWGSALAAEATLHYLRSRPWVHFLNAAELAALPTVPGSAIPATGGLVGHTDPTLPGSPNQATLFRPDLSSQMERLLLDALLAAPDNALSVAAWQAFWSQYTPVYPISQRLPELRGPYAIDILTLLAGAEWAEHPTVQESCEDINFDGISECILSNGHFYAQFNARTGTLSHLFVIHAGHVHQVIAPTHQIISGLSDPNTWAPFNWDIIPYSPPDLIDPAVLPGAFYEADKLHVPWFENHRLYIIREDGIRKSFYFEGNAFVAEYDLPEAYADPGLKKMLPEGFEATTSFPFLTIPIALSPDPWQRFTSGWSHTYRLSHSDNSLAITPPGSDDFTIRLSSSAPLTVQAFSDTLEFLPRAENPDREIPPGHFLPFPVFRIDISTIGQSQVMIRIGTSP